MVESAAALWKFHLVAGQGHSLGAGMIKVSIVEDDARFAELVAWALSNRTGIEVAGKHLNAEEALREILREHPDVVLMDINLPDMNGIECLRRLKEFKPKLPSAPAFNASNTKSSLGSPVRIKTRVLYLTKDEVLGDLWRPIHAVHEGGGAMSPKIARRVMERFQQPPDSTAGSGAALSVREKEVLELLAHGRMYKEIADMLGISINTVRKHLQAVYGKLDVRTRHDATQYYRRQQDCAADVILLPSTAFAKSATAVKKALRRIGA